MLTIVETPTFSALWPDYWSEEELGEFCCVPMRATWSKAPAVAARYGGRVKARARAGVCA